MKEKDLKELGFKRIDAELVNHEKPFYYYIKEFTYIKEYKDGKIADDYHCLITPANDEVKKNKWYVMLDDGNKQFKKRKEVEMLFRLFFSNPEVRNLQIAVNNLIREEARPEAMEILRLANSSEREEFYSYYMADNGNIACSCLDMIKSRLYDKGKIKNDDNSHFGSMIDLFEN